MPHTKAKPVVNTRIQARNKELILAAAVPMPSPPAGSARSKAR